jgi:hypothetical protein
MPDKKEPMKSPAAKPTPNQPEKRPGMPAKPAEAKPKPQAPKPKH